MKSQTSIVATNVQLQQWAMQIKSCQNRPAGMDIQTWCDQNNLSKSNYYYRLRRVRQACLNLTSASQTVEFIEVPPVSLNQRPIVSQETTDTAASIVLPGGLRIDITNHASETFLLALIGASSHAK